MKLDKAKGIKPDDMELFLRTKEKNPILYERVLGLLGLVHESVLRKADDVEFEVIDRLRNMGNDALTSWSSNQSAQARDLSLEQQKNLRRGEKKSPLEDNVR